MKVPRLPLSKVDIEAFQRDGVVLVKNVLTPAQVNAGRTAVDAAVLNPGPQAELISPDSTWDSVAGSFQTSANDDSNSNHNNNNEKPQLQSQWTMFQDQFASKRCPEMMDFIRQSPAPQLAATMLSAAKNMDTFMGTNANANANQDKEEASTSSSSSSDEEAVLFYDHVIVKKPSPQNANKIPWHQDLPYWSVQGGNIVSVWMCFDPMPPTSAVQWICGSHQWGQFQPRHFVDSSPYEGTDSMTPMPDIEDLVASGKVTVKTFDACEPGDALVFDARIIHGSPGYSTTEEEEETSLPKTHHHHHQEQHRRVALRFASGDTLYYHRKNRETAIPTPDISHSLKHGDKLCSDGAFPVLWPPSREDQEEKDN